MTNYRSDRPFLSASIPLFGSRSFRGGWFATLARRSWAGAALALVSLGATAQTLAPGFAGKYVVSNHGPVPQGDNFVFRAGDPDRIVMAPGSSSEDTIREYPVQRDPTGKITGFGDSPVPAATARPLSENDRVYWLSYGPSNVLFFRGGFDTPTFGQLKPSSASPDARIALADLGIDRCCYGGYGQTKVVPAGFPGAGRVKLTAGDRWYDTTVSLAANGTWTVAALSAPLVLSDGFVGQNFVFVAAGLPGVTKPSVLLSISDGSLYLFELDPNGDPILGTKTAFMDHVSDLGDVDPRTGDFLLFTGDPTSLVTVSPGQGPPPKIQPTDPADGTLVNVGTRVIFTGTAVQENGAIAKITLFQDGVEADTSDGPFTNPDGHADYFLGSKTLTLARTYEFRIVATAGNGNSVTSPPVRIIASVAPNQLPVAVLTPAFDGPAKFLCQSVPLNASGSDPDGTVKNLYLLDGSQLLKTLPLAGGRIVLRGLSIGAHILTLQVQDNRGGIGTASITVNILPPPANTMIGDFQDDGRYGVCFTGELGKAFQAEWSDPTGGLEKWSPLERRVATKEPLKWVDPTSGGAAVSRLYRVRLVP